MSRPTANAGDPVAARLRPRISGRVIGPNDAGYDEARKLFYGWIDRRPSAIVKVANAKDVSAAIAVAREEGLPLAVRSGGHSGAGHSVCNGGIVIDLSTMKSIEVDPAGRTAWAETGMTAGDYLAATSSHGLSTGFGDTGTVGIGGITLGGGMGFLVRKFGLTIDELLAADVVLADGSLVRADADHHPDLFWALRGGGGNFGVATRFQFRLREVDRVLGGMLLQPATAQVLASLVEYSVSVPDELSLIANAMIAPPMPFIPAEWHGRPIIITMLVYAGPPDDGEKVVAPLRALATPIADMIRPMRYREMFEGEGPHPTAGSSRSIFMDRFDRADAEAIMDALHRSTASMAVMQIRTLGGAMARVPADATAFAHRDRRFLVNVAALYERPEDFPIHESWVQGLSDSLRKVDDAVYVNFLGNEGGHRVAHAYPGRTLKRLASIKAAVDPLNVFSGNHNILPSAS